MNIILNIIKYIKYYIKYNYFRKENHRYDKM